MAKATKAASKATTTTKKPVKKATVPKRAVTKRSSKPAASESSFFQVRFTDQSIYWVIFGAVAIGFALWIYTLDAKIRDLYDQIDANTYNSDSSLYMQKQKADQPKE